MKKLISLMIVSVIGVAMVFGMTACGNKDTNTDKKANVVVDNTSKDADNTAENTEGEVKDEAVEKPQEEIAEDSGEDAKSDEQAEESAQADDEALTPEVAEEFLDIAFGDFEAQEALSKAIQNGEKKDMAVSIDGISKSVGTKYSIGQEKDGKFIGTNYTMKAEYPADGVRVKVTGKVVQDGLAFIIQADKVELVGEDAETEEDVTDIEDTKDEVSEDAEVKTLAKAIPEEEYATPNKKFSFTVETGAELDIDTYQWQFYMADRDKWHSIQNNKSASTKTLVLATPNTNIDGTKYRCVITLKDGTEIISGEGMLKVK